MPRFLTVHLVLPTWFVFSLIYHPGIAGIQMANSDAFWSS